MTRLFYKLGKVTYTMLEVTVEAVCQISRHYFLELIRNDKHSDGVR